MGAPIVIPQRQSPWSQLLPQMFMMKVKHNMDLQTLDAETKLETAKLKEKREYQEKTTLDTEKRAETGKIETENRKEVTDKRNKGWFLASEIKDPIRRLKGTTKMVGGKLMYYPDTPNETETHYPMWEKDQWKMVKKENLKAYVHPKDQNAKVVYKRGNESPPPGYLPYSSPLVTINNKPSIAEKEKQQNVAYFQSPKFYSDVLNDAKKTHGKMWDYYASEPEKQKELTRNIADIKVKAQFGNNAKFGKDKDTGNIGWFVQEGNDYKMVAPWGE